MDMTTNLILLGLMLVFFGIAAFFYFYKPNPNKGRAVSARNQRGSKNSRRLR